jgi:hypothetical protein
MLAKARRQVVDVLVEHLQRAGSPALAQSTTSFAVTFSRRASFPGDHALRFGRHALPPHADERRAAGVTFPAAGVPAGAEHAAQHQDLVADLGAHAV